MKDAAEVVERLAISGKMDRAVAETLQLEVRRLAKRYGLQIEEVRIEEVVSEPE